MNRRAFLTSFSVGVPAVFAQRAQRPPNIVLILADDLGWGDLQSYGAPDIRTPNIDAIGRAGIRFTQFYDNGPECSPTRCALMTGRYQQRVGGLECAIGLNDVGRYDDAEWLQKRGELGLPVSETAMPRIFKSNGYDTAMFGKWHLGYRDKFWPNAHGFDEFFGFLGGGANYFTHREPEAGGNVNFYHNTTRLDMPGYTTDLFADKAIEWLKRRSQTPFFLYMPFNAPHQPIQDPDSKDPEAIAPAAPKSRPTYCKMVERLDACVGRLLSQLDRMGAAGNTIVLFLSDNGADPNGRNEPYRGRKTTVWEGGIRVPCLIRWPGVIQPGTVSTQPAITMDLLPTLLAAAGAKPPADRKLDGVNLVPLLRGEQQPFSRTLFWRYKRADRIRKAVHDGNLKYVNDSGEEALHDLSTDEREQKNLLPQASADAQRLKNKLAAWERDVMAPRLKPFRSEPG